MTPRLPAQTPVLLAPRVLLSLVSLTSILACSSSSGGSDDPPASGVAGGSTGGANTAGAAGTPASAGKSNGEGGRTGGDAGASSMAGKASGGSQAQGGSAGQGGGDNAEMGPQEYGFTLRKPGEKHLDWLCTFNSGADSGYVYVRLLQTGIASAGLASTPVYEAELAQISLEGAVTTLQGAKYDYGGGHHNDALSFDYGGKTHNYYHSSFGFGFRSCQAMDCRNVYALGTTTLATEGCTSARSLPEVCVSIEADGSHAALVDEFMKCPGDAS